MAMTALGIGGSLLTGGNKDLDSQIKRYKRLAETGVGVDKLAAPGAGAVNTAYADAVRRSVANAAASGLAGTSLINAGNADLFEKRGKAVGDVYAKAVAENEASKQRARDSLLGLLGMKSSQQNAAQQALGGLTGAGLQGMIRGFSNLGNTNPFSFDTSQQLPDSSMGLKQNASHGFAGFGD